MKFFTLVLIALVSSVYFVGFTSSVSDCPPTGYCPRDDLDDDGDIDIFDIVEIAGRYGTSGEPLIGRAAIEYDSSWLNITDKCGQYFSVVHNLNSTEIMVDISGKTGVDGVVHQRNLGGTGFIPGWTETYGGANGDYGNSVAATFDGGLIVVGSTRSFGAWDIDFWLVKTDALGNLLWNQTYKGAREDLARYVIQTNDEGYAIAGDTDSFGAGGKDAWLIKTDRFGNHVWNQTYGGTSADGANSVVQTSDGGYIIIGSTGSSGAGNWDAWLIKTDASGNHQWNQTYGGVNTDHGITAVPTGDYGYVIAGYTQSFGAGGYDLWLVKTDKQGNHVWNQTYGGVDNDYGSQIVRVADGYMITGWTQSFGAGSYDAWLIKTDASGNHQWNQTYGGTDQDYGRSLVQTTDGGYAIGGHTESYGAGAGDSDFWLVKTDALGNLLWEQTYGGSSADRGLSMVQTSDGGYVLAGETESFGAGSFDFWLVRISMESGVAWTASMADSIILYRGATDSHWNYVQVRIWKIRETP